MTIPRIQHARLLAPAHPSAHAVAPKWLAGLEKLTRAQADNLDAYEKVGPNSSASDSAKGKAAIAAMPKSVRDFFAKQESAARDNDGAPALLRFNLSEISPKLHGSAYAVRWTSEDQSLDRLFVYDQTGKEVAKGTTDTGGDYKWTLAKAGKPFAIDDSPH